MEYIQKFFAVIVDFIVFALTGKTLSFAATFAEIQSFTSSFDELHNVFAWANAFLPIELIRFLLTTTVIFLVAKLAVRITCWVIDIISL